MLDKDLQKALAATIQELSFGRKGSLGVHPLGSPQLCLIHNYGGPAQLLS